MPESTTLGPNSPTASACGVPFFALRLSASRGNLRELQDSDVGALSCMALDAAMYSIDTTIPQGISGDTFAVGTQRYIAQLLFRGSAYK